MRVQNVRMTSYQKQQNFTALPKGRAPEPAELIAEVRAVLESGSKEAAQKLMADYKVVQPQASHGINIFNIVYLEAGGSPALKKACDLFGIQHAW